ncbi:hypothetical protein DRW48_10330 [Paracoccus suum]|uniref:Uncharacterized protein n=1 Tax=Paracoccus suum TaxID=2259340 RepID=A0A344PKX9_9RHOB|nr:hypothetical protein [Paracoccus suum]AXC50034.1 hypothetical protein DRW48_10330 [Paracoccus suum]
MTSCHCCKGARVIQARDLATGIAKTGICPICEGTGRADRVATAKDVFLRDLLTTINTSAALDECAHELVIDRIKDAVRDGSYGAETYHAEPYSWGGSRGTETTITLTSWSLCCHDLTRDDAVLLLGETPVTDIEDTRTPFEEAA